MLLRIEGHDLPGLRCGPSPDFPGYENIHVGVQRKDRPGELLDLQPGDAASVVWELECEPVEDEDGLSLRGRYIQNRLGGRFVYLSWGTVDEDGAFHMFRRLKLLLRKVDSAVMRAGVDAGLLVVKVGLTDAKGNPACGGSPVWEAGAA